MHKYDTQEIEQWSTARKTSEEITRALIELTDGDEQEMDRIWETPSPVDHEEEQVLGRAWDLADEDTETLYWGVESFDRP